MSLKIDPSYQEDEELGDQLQYEEKDYEEEVEVFSCKYCKFQTEDVDDLDEHIISHEEAVLEDEEEVDAPDSFAGGSSDKGNSSLSPTISGEPEGSVRHFTISQEKKPKQDLPAFYEECANKTIKKVLVCPYCGYQTMIKLDLNRHLKSHKQPVELPVYVCAECPYTTRRKCDMPKHLLTHCENGTVPMYKCPECPYATKRKGDLNKHALGHRKPSMTVYSCSQCPYSSTRHGDLKKHLVCHDNSSTKDPFIFNCTECGYTSKRLNDLNKHVVLHCDRDAKGVFKCTRCDYASLAGSHFAKHVLSRCEVTEMCISLASKDSSTQDYIVLGDEELHVYQLKEDNVASVQVLEGDAVGSNKRKRRISIQYSSKKSNLEAYASEEIEDNCGDGEENRVVVLTGFEDNEQNVKCAV